VLLGPLRAVRVRAVLVSGAFLLWGPTSSLTYAESPAPAAEINLFLDLDKDGGMSYEEFVQSLDTQSMTALDSDHDGFLSEEEVRTQVSTAQNSISLRFSEIDTDGDKRLSAKELEAATRKSPRVRVLYDALDVDHSNRVSPSELRNPPLGVGLLRVEF
jgi:Ca2+-binding EF-hand superfamily protein